MEDLTTEDGRLLSAFVAALPGYLENRARELGVGSDAPQLESAIAEAVSALNTNLNELLRMPLDAQVESPLELVRRATAPVSDALERMGIQVPQRDDWESEAHPEDRYGLYPASSQALGDEAWRLHLDWGKRKALAVADMVPATGDTVAVRPPAVALFGVPVDQRDALTSAIQQRGFEVLVWRNPAALERAAERKPVAAVVHLSHPAAHEAIRRLGAENIDVVATGATVDDLMMPGLLALGAKEVVAWDHLSGRLNSLLPDLV